MSIKIPLITEFNGKGIRRAVEEFKQLETTGQKAQFAISKAALPAAAALAGLGAAAFSATKAAIEDQAAQVELARSLRQTTKATDAVIAANEEWISTQGRLLGVADDELRPVLSSLARATGDVTRAQRIATQAMDISAATGKPLAEVTDALTKALGGNMRGLQSLTPEFRKMIRQGASFDDVMAEIAKTMGGAATTAADTVQGRIRRLRVGMNEAKESIGNAFIPALEAALPMLQSMAIWIEENSGLVVAFGVAIGVMSGAIIAAKAAMVIWNAISAITTAVNIALATSFTAVQVATGIGIIAAVAGAAALVAYSSQIKRTIGDVNKFAGATDGMTLAQKAAYYGLSETEYQLGTFSGPLDDARNKIREYAAGVIRAKDGALDFNTSLGGGESAATKLARKLKELRTALRDQFATALDSANERLKAAKEAFNALAQDVSQSITSAFSFRDAQEAAKETGSSFLNELAKQVAKTRDFTVKVNRLIAAGLSEAALQQVLAAGQDAGGAIADELLNGGADAIRQANALTAEVQTLGDTVGQNAAVQFRQAGIDAGNALVAAISQTVSKFKLKLSSKGLTEKQLARMRKNFALEVDFLLAGGAIPALADGGIVSGPTLALIGEAGPEAVVPLDRMGSMGAPNVTINVNGGDPQAVVNALRTYMRQNGSVPIRVSNLY